MKFGAIVVDGRNKIGGHVASKNRGGSYLRTKVTPVNPQSSAQVGVRNNFTASSQAWRGLSDTQRSSFEAAVEDYKRTDIFGDIRNPSGFNLFMRLNQNLREIGQSPITAAPLPISVPPMVTLSVAADESAQTVIATFTPTPIPAGYMVVFEATPPVSAGRTYVKSLFRKILVVDAAGTSPQALTTQYVAKFGAFVTGQRITVRAKMVSKTTGQTSQYLSATTVVVA